jgi:hypothetical protein
MIFSFVEVDQNIVLAFRGSFGNWLNDIPMLHEPPSATRKMSTMTSPRVPGVRSRWTWEDHMLAVREDAQDLALRIRVVGRDPAQIFAQAIGAILDRRDCAAGNRGRDK